MQKLKKILLIVPMICMLCMSFIGTAARAEDKINTTSTAAKSEQSKENTAENKTNVTNADASTGSKNTAKDDSESTATSKSTAADTKNVSETNSSKKNPSNTFEIPTIGKEEMPETLPAWKNIRGKLYYVTNDGILKKLGWFKEKEENPNADNDNEYYFDIDYAATIGWKKIDNSWYYFNESGIKQTGWKFVNYNWYLLDQSGKMEKGWVKNNGHKYYLNDEGIMVSGKKYIDNKWYFFAQDGALETGLYTYNGKLYYSDSEGVMVANQWVKINNDKYYVKADSGVATGYAVIDNAAESFDLNGRYTGPVTMKEHLFVKHLNVGSADCAFIKLPNGETVLIDTGTPETSEKLINFLKSQELKKKDGKEVIDYIVITHGHSDHIGGIPAILENFNVGKVYIPKIAVMKDWYSDVKVTAENTNTVNMMKTDYEIYNNAVKAMKDKNIKFLNTGKGEFIDKDKILQFVQSDKDFGGIGSEKIAQYYWGINDNSAIVFLNYGDLQELFTADMEWTSEKDFWTSDLLKGRKIDLLKVPHHGNSTSSTPDFINYLQPAVGIISRAQGADTNTTADKNLLSNGVSIYETSKKDGISIYATQDNWTLQE